MPARSTVLLRSIKGEKSHGIIEQSLVLLDHLNAAARNRQRKLRGDGAGILIQIPDALFRDWASTARVTLPGPGHYAVAVCFLPPESRVRDSIVKEFERSIKLQGQRLVGWRDVPTTPTSLSRLALNIPVVRQAIITHMDQTSKTKTVSKESS